MATPEDELKAALAVIKHEQSFLSMVAQYSPSLALKAIKESEQRMKRWLETGELDPAVTP